MAEDGDFTYRDMYYSMNVRGLSKARKALAKLGDITDKEQEMVLYRGAYEVLREIFDFLAGHHWASGDLARSFDIETGATATFVKPKQVEKTTKLKGGRIRRVNMLHKGSGHTTQHVKNGFKSSHHGPGNTMPDIAWYLHSGTRRIKGDAWFDTVEENAREKVYDAIEQALDYLIASKGF